MYKQYFGSFVLKKDFSALFTNCGTPCLTRKGMDNYVLGNHDTNGRVTGKGGSWPDDIVCKFSDPVSHARLVRACI